MEEKSIFTNSKISIKTRKRFLKFFIWSVLLYGNESLAISTEMKRKPEAIEMCCYWRMLKISWMEFVSNEKVLRQVKEQRRILTSITQRQPIFFGHTISDNSLERLVLEGKTDRSISRGRQRKKYLDDLVAAVGCLRKGEPFHLTQDRDSDAWSPISIDMAQQERYVGLVESHFRYCCSVWGSCGITRRASDIKGCVFGIN